MHGGANSSNWIQNNRVSISIRAQCVYTQVPSPYLDTRLNKRSSYICDWLPSVFVVIAIFIASRVDLSYESNRSIFQFITSRSRDRLSIILSIHPPPSSSLSNNLPIVGLHFALLLFFPSFWALNRLQVSWNSWRRIKTLLWHPSTAWSRCKHVLILALVSNGETFVRRKKISDAILYDLSVLINVAILRFQMIVSSFLLFLCLEMGGLYALVFF